MAVTSTLAVIAIQSRDAARDQRREAEGLIGFMLGDLRDKLEPIGELDALDGVGSRVLAYYQKLGTTDLSDAALLQRSKALSLMAEVANLRGDSDGALRLYREAATGTEEAIDARRPIRSGCSIMRRTCFGSVRLRASVATAQERRNRRANINSSRPKWWRPTATT